MATKPLPDQATLLKLLRYEPETGKLFWRERPGSMFDHGPCLSAFARAKAWNAAHADKEAFLQARPFGHLSGMILRKNYMAHRIIWKMAYGLEPDEVDHINGDPRDNRLANLRSVSPSDNCRNRRIRADNSSGVHGVYWQASDGRWRAQIGSGKSRKCLGSFTDKVSAIAARKAAEITEGFHPNHGRI